MIGEVKYLCNTSMNNVTRLLFHDACNFNELQHNMFIKLGQASNINKKQITSTYAKIQNSKSFLKSKAYCIYFKQLKLLKIISIFDLKLKGESLQGQKNFLQLIFDIFID
jgi:hypothetical protein